MIHLESRPVPGQPLPPTTACRCGEPTVLAHHQGGLVVLDAAPLPPGPTSPGTYVLDRRAGQVVARAFNAHLDVVRRRWQPHGCPASAEVCVVLDFETADHGRDSACALALARLEGDVVTRSWSSLVRPPRREFRFTHLHGVTWEHCRTAPRFAAAWASAGELLTGAQCLVAHNAPFDRSVLAACLEAAGLPAVKLPWLCTWQLSKKVWDLPCYGLDDLAGHLNLTLRHHNAASDVQACTQVLIQARRELGAKWEVGRHLAKRRPAGRRTKKVGNAARQHKRSSGAGRSP